MTETELEELVKTFRVFAERIVATTAAVEALRLRIEALEVMAHADTGGK